jgi:hypothetical protein
MIRVTASILALGLLVSCGDSGSATLSPRASDFYEREVISVDGQNYSLVTRPAEYETDEEQYFVFIDGRYFECDAPTVEACAPVVRNARAMMSDGDY